MFCSPVERQEFHLASTKVFDPWKLFKFLKETAQCPPFVVATIVPNGLPFEFFRSLFPVRILIPINWKMHLLHLNIQRMLNKIEANSPHLSSLKFFPPRHSWWRTGLFLNFPQMAVESTGTWKSPWSSCAMTGNPTGDIRRFHLNREGSLLLANRGSFGARRHWSTLGRRKPTEKRKSKCWSYQTNAFFAFLSCLYLHTTCGQNCMQAANAEQQLEY